MGEETEIVKAKPVETGYKTIAVPAGKGERHVTADRVRTLCGVEIPGEWYTSDAGVFGRKGDCSDCYEALAA